MHVIVDGRRAGDPGRDRAAGRGRRRRAPGRRGRRRPARAPRRSWSSSWLPTSAGRAWPRRRCATRSGPRPASGRRGAGVAAVLVVRTAARRHPAQLQDRPARVGAWAAAGARRASAGHAVKVLVTGGSSLLGAGVARPCTPAATTSSCCSACGRSRRRARPDARSSATSPTRPRSRAAVQGVDAVDPPRGQVSSGRQRGTSSMTTNVDRHPERARRRAGARRPPAGLISSPSVAHSGRPLVAAGADPADPEHARATTRAARRWPS